MLEHDLGLRLLSRTMPVLDAVGTQNAALRELVSTLVLDTLADLNHRTVVTGMRRQWAMLREVQIRLGLG